MAVKKVKNNLDDDDDITNVAATAFVGNADSVTTRSITNGTEFTWRVKVSPRACRVKDCARRCIYCNVEDPDNSSNNS